MSSGEQLSAIETRMLRNSQVAWFQYWENNYFQVVPADNKRSFQMSGLPRMVGVLSAPMERRICSRSRCNSGRGPETRIIPSLPMAASGHPSQVPGDRLRRWYWPRAALCGWSGLSMLWFMFSHQYLVRFAIENSA